MFFCTSPPQPALLRCWSLFLKANERQKSALDKFSLQMKLACESLHHAMYDYLLLTLYFVVCAGVEIHKFSICIN
jgi:hypothetical protein